MYIYVQAQDGTPLMPTRRAGKVRRMLRDGSAVIASHTPFTVRLTYETTRFVQNVNLGIDAGSRHIGLSATTESRELFAAEVQLRPDIVDNLSTRREARRTRRSKRSVRYRAPRFDNRRESKKPGWLAPSERQRVESHVNAVNHVCSILPIKSIVIEAAQFDTQKIKDPNIEGTGYQSGEQLGFWNVREYVLYRDGHRCRHCRGESGDQVLNVHHIESRKTGGNSPDNLITLCETCHHAYHRGEFELKIDRNAWSLRDAAAMSIMRWTVYNRLKKTHGDKNVKMTFGYITKHTRIENGLEKSHSVDARCISGHPAAVPCEDELHLRQLRRHNRKVMKSNILKGGRWKRNQAPREIKGFRLFDSVKHNGTPVYVHGRRTTGYFVVKTYDGQTLSNSVNCKALRLVRHNNNFLYNSLKRNNPIPPTNEFVGFLGKFS